MKILPGKAFDGRPLNKNWQIPIGLLSRNYFGKIFRRNSLKESRRLTIAKKILTTV